MTGKKTFFAILALSAVSVLLSACLSTSPTLRKELAKRIAMPKFMLERVIEAKPFYITAYERVRNDQAVTVYIEGDGAAWLTRNRISLDPTPTDPIALRLAAADTAKNVVWLSRPCQYHNWIYDSPCPDAYWTSKRYSPEVIEAFDKTLDNIKRQYGTKYFHLVGFSGGAAVAVLVAAVRDDVLSIRTVAGNLDHKALSDIHEVSYLDGSLNPADFATEIADIPQRHFVGGKDMVIPPAIYHSFRQASGNSTCIRYTLVEDADHENGWVGRWRELLDEPVDCESGQ